MTHRHDRSRSPDRKPASRAAMPVSRPEPPICDSEDLSSRSTVPITSDAHPGHVQHGGASFGDPHGPFKVMMSGLDTARPEEPLQYLDLLAKVQVIPRSHIVLPNGVVGNWLVPEGAFEEWTASFTLPG